VAEELSFNNNILNGRCTTYFDNGKPKRIREYINGEITQESLFDETGKKI
jgi:antitoxin component YwqK of YwqJK toxin-antitoxin module